MFIKLLFLNNQTKQSVNMLIICSFWIRANSLFNFILNFLLLKSMHLKKHVLMKIKTLLLASGLSREPLQTYYSYAVCYWCRLGIMFEYYSRKRLVI